MRKVLFVTSRREDLRALYYEARGEWAVSGVSDPLDSVQQISTGGYDLVFFDLALSGAHGPDLLLRISSIPAHPPIFILSHEFSSCFLKFSLSYGIAEYFRIPYSINRLFEAVNRFFEASDRAQCSSPSAVSDPPVAYGPDSATGCTVHSAQTDDPVELQLSRVLLGKSNQMENVRRAILRYRNHREPVLITGETGCGKDLVARLLHRHSPVFSGPFAACNVSCIPPTLAESMLFGTERGSYTDARDAPGFFERAHKGTLFLDEIGELDRYVQPKFLRVLEDKEVTRVGGSLIRKVDFRLLCATNCRMADEVSKGRFRADLFHRIDVLRVHVPPLREHPDDIPLLAASYLPTHKKTLSVGALDKLQRHDWPGNVRDLFNCLSRAAGESPSAVIQSSQIQF